MKKIKFHSSLFVLFALFASLVSSCSQNTTQVSPATAVPPTATKVLPTVAITVISPPSADAAIKTYLDAWAADDYATMYALLNAASRAAITPEAFAQRYQQVAVQMTLKKIEYKIETKVVHPTSAQVSFQVTYHTNMVGDFVRPMKVDLGLEEKAWKMQWDDGLVLPELKGGNTLQLTTTFPTRGNLYDRNGNDVAVQTDEKIYAFGFRKTPLDSGQESLLLNDLSKLTGRAPELIRRLYDNDYTYQGDYVPIGEALKSDVSPLYDGLASLANFGLVINDYNGRFYPFGGLAPHVTGYVQAIPADQKDAFLRKGYNLGARIGANGLEQNYEQVLAGQPKAVLDVINPQGDAVTRLSQVEGKAPQSIYMTIDSKLQREAQQAIFGFTGAIVVLERDSGRVLAMVSSPGFDPNGFECDGNENLQFCAGWGAKLGDGQQRLFNRATNNGYPLGSVFKIITMATALQTGAFKPKDTLDCQHTYTIDDRVLDDWTKEKGYPPSGVLTLPEGLMRSCNPWFYHIGETLYTQGRGAEISNMARAFGLGSPTGIEGVEEYPGNIPDPSDKLDAAYVAIGQSRVQVNPLQVARFVAAIGNGGTLFKPQVIEKIVAQDGKESKLFQPDAQGKLPVSDENLKVIQGAMWRVVNDPRGTASDVFPRFSIPVYGKTGTAQSGTPNPHAWFAAYSNAGKKDRPDIAVAVLAEFAGEGSEIAAPIARRIMEIYFLGKPVQPYPWENKVNVPRVTPTPTVPLPPGVQPTETPPPTPAG